MSARRTGFTLIELLVVVAIIALLVSILLPSLNKAREQAKTSVCASQLRSFGQASAIYESEYDSFVPCDPWWKMPEYPTGHPEVIRTNDEAGNYDPAHGWLAFYGMKIKPEISGNPMYDPWEKHPYGFRYQTMLAPDTLWEGFFCPTQNRRNTMMEDSPELDFAQQFEGRPVLFKYASAYMVNRCLRSATWKQNGVTRWPAKPSASFDAGFTRDGPTDNIYGESDQEGIFMDHDDGYPADQPRHTQAVNMSEVRDPGQTMYMADSLDYHLSPPDSGSLPYTGTGWTAGVEVSAGAWIAPFHVNFDHRHNVLGARHLTKANVLYADSHVDNDNQTPRDKRGSQVIASTFADYMGTYQMGTQHHMAPFGRHP